MVTIITADIDYKDSRLLLLYLRKAFFKIKKIEKIVISKSTNNKYHLTIYTPTKYTLRQKRNIRLFIGDDYRRVKLDKLRLIGQETLFNKKGKIHNGKKELKKEIEGKTIRV